MFLGTPAAFTSYDLGGRVPVLTRCHWPSGSTGATALSDGTIIGAASQCYHRALVACSSLVVVYAMSGAYEAEAGAITSSTVPGTVTLATSLWTGGAGTAPPTGTAHDFAFGAGTTVAMTDKQIAVSDPMTVTLAQDDIVFTRNLVTVPSGGSWPLAWPGASPTLGYHDGEVTWTTDPGIDYLHGTAIADSNGGNKGWRPLAVLGIPA